MSFPESFNQYCFNQYCWLPFMSSAGTSLGNFSFILTSSWIFGGFSICFFSDWLSLLPFISPFSDGSFCPGQLPGNSVRGGNPPPYMWPGYSLQCHVSTGLFVVEWNYRNFFGIIKPPPSFLVSKDLWKVWHTHKPIKQTAKILQWNTEISILINNYIHKKHLWASSPKSDSSTLF